MTAAKQARKMAGSVAAYLDHRGVAHGVPAGLTFAMLCDLAECCDPLALESAEAREAAYARLAVLKANAPIYTPLNPLEEKAAGLLTVDEAAAVRGYARKRGIGYARHIIHVITHPRGKSAETLAEAELKLAEAVIAIQPERVADLGEYRAHALSKAAAHLLRA